MSVFKLNYNKLVRLLLPVRLRRGVMLAFLNALCAPIKRIYGSFYLARWTNIYRIEHGQHVAHLEAVLNDAFDPAFRRIRVKDSSGNHRPIYLRKRVENRPTYVYLTAENRPQHLFTRNEIYFGGIDFDVEIPLYMNYDEQLVEKLINLYKTPGTNFQLKEV